MLRILHLNASNYYGGPEKQIIEHLKRVDKTQITGMLASFEEYGCKNDILEKGKTEQIKTFTISAKGALDFQVFRQLQTILKDEKIDLLCTHGFKSTVTGWWVAKKINVPVLAFSRGYTAENKKVAFYEWLDRQVLKRVQGIVSVSYGQKKKIESYGIQCKSHFVVHNAVELPKYSQPDEKFRHSLFDEYGIPPNAFIIVSAGRLSPEKGHRHLIKAMAILKDQCPNLFLIICGDGRCRPQLEKIIKSLGIFDRILFTGFRMDILEIFKIMEYLVLPSLTEGLPNVVLEAFSLGKTVVATEVGGVPELVRNHINGLLVPAENPFALAEAMHKLYISSTLRNTLGQKGKSIVSREFSFEKQNTKLEKIYFSILHPAKS